MPSVVWDLTIEPAAGATTAAHPYNGSSAETGKQFAVQSSEE